MSALQIVEPDIQDLQQSSSDMVAHAEMLDVVDDSTFAAGGEMLLDLKKTSKIVEARFKEPVDLAHKAHKSLVALRDSVLKPFGDAERIIKQKIGSYQLKVEQARRVEAEALRKEAEAKAEAERIAKAQDQMDKGDLEACERTLAAPIAPVAVRVTTPEPPKVDRISMRDVWKFEVYDESLLPRKYLMQNEKSIRAEVSGQMGNTSIPGVRVWSEKLVTGRS